MGIKPWLVQLLGAGALCLGVAACGDDAGNEGGCSTDVDCKGDRVCDDGVCVDPGGSDGDPDAGASSGTGGTAGNGGSGGGRGGSSAPRAGSGGAIDDPELEQACSVHCEARHAAECSMNIGSLDQCLAQCLVVDEQNYGYCHDEQTAQYACLASGGYTCVSGYPQPKSTCISESQALSMCSQRTPCRLFCSRAEGDCAPSGEACETECQETQTGFEDAICGVYYSQLLSCWGQKLTCTDGRPSVTGCESAVIQVGECIARRQHECDGFCWVAERLGCGSDTCLSDCRAKADQASCGTYYRNLIECAIGDSSSLGMSCVDGQPTPASPCDSYQQQYTDCMPE